MGDGRSGYFLGCRGRVTTQRYSLCLRHKHTHAWITLDLRSFETETLLCVYAPIFGNARALSIA